MTIAHVRQTIADYPRAFWILFGGTLVNTAAAAFLWLGRYQASRSALGSPALVS